MSHDPMNHFLLRFARLRLDGDSAAYRVESLDFSDSDDWEDMGLLQIDLASGGYQFDPGLPWRRERILPPKFYALSEAAQAREFHDIWEPRHSGLGAYALRVHTFAMECLQARSLPLAHPAELFTLEAEPSYFGDLLPTPDEALSTRP